MGTITQLYGLNNDALAKSQVFIAGLECEIESVRNRENLAGFKATEDGSLRNSGVEFISPPVDRLALGAMFKNLHASLHLYNREEAFSPRTSTHVHVNCKSLNDEQVKNIVLMYALLEEFFFAMVDGNRRGNIHCVPLSETFLSNYYNANLNHMLQRWHKYTALNLLPLAKLGTIEFRHLQGTNDQNLLEEWLLALDKLWSAGQKIQVDEALLTNHDALLDLFLMIFNHSKKVMALLPCFDDLTQASIIDVKLSLVK